MYPPAHRRQIKEFTEEMLGYASSLSGGTFGSRVELNGVVVSFHAGTEGISWGPGPGKKSYGSRWPVFQWISSLSVPQYMQRGLAILAVVDDITGGQSASIIRTVCDLFGTKLIEDYYRISMDLVSSFQLADGNDAHRAGNPSIIYWDRAAYADTGRPRLLRHDHTPQNNKYNVDIIYDAILVRWYTTDREGIEVAGWIKDCLSTMAIQIENVFVNMEYELDDVVTLAVDKLKQSCRAVTKANDELKRIREELIASGGWLPEETRATVFPTMEPVHILTFVKNIRSQIEATSKIEVKE